jgi:malonyl CoA-acyl carrier protein transacylase
MGSETMREQPLASVALIAASRLAARREGRLRALQRGILVSCSLGVLGAAALHLAYLIAGGH